HDVMAEAGMPGESRMMKDLFQERLRRPIVFGTDANAERREIVEEKVHPMIRGDDDQHVGPRRHHPLADLAETLLDRSPWGRRETIPFARDHRAVARRIDADKTSHVTLPLPRPARSEFRSAAG